MSDPHAVDRSFSWLGRFPIALDLADTVRILGTDEFDLLGDDHALSVWVDAELPRFSYVEAARGHLTRVRRLRDAVRGLLRASIEGDPLPGQYVDLINEASNRCPSFPTLTRDGHKEAVETNEDPYDVFAAEVARSTMAVVSGEAGAVMVCRAPRCGMFFTPMNRRQRWCSSACGNRARVARHASRTGRRRKD